MFALQHQLAVVSQSGAGQDRAAVFARGRERVAVVADGAGGTSGGAEAAELVVEHVRRVVESDTALDAPGLWKQVLLEVSIALEGTGQTTAVVAGERWGASVGDSGAWLITADGFTELTAHQKRKPLLGGGLSEPVTFKLGVAYDQTLLLATDGLFKYAKPERICELSRRHVLDAHALVDAARLPGGSLQDDVAVVLLRRARSSPSPDTSEGELEQWLSTLVPHALDGVVVSLREPERLAGVMWFLDPQTTHPFEVFFSAEAIELKWGDAAAPGGFPADAKRVTAGLTRTWLERRVIPR